MEAPKACESQIVKPKRNRVTRVLLMIAGTVSLIFAKIGLVLPLFNYTKLTWFFKKRVGGVIYDIASHVFDFLNFLFGDYLMAISARGSSYLDQPLEDYSSFIPEYTKGRFGIGTVSWLSSKVIENSNIFGTAQNLYASSGFSMRESLKEFNERSMLGAALEAFVTMRYSRFPFTRVRRSDIYQLEINHFLDTIMKNQYSSTNALNDLSVVLIIDAAHKSLEKGFRIKIPIKTVSFNFGEFTNK